MLRQSRGGCTSLGLRGVDFQPRSSAAVVVGTARSSCVPQGPLQPQLMQLPVTLCAPRLRSVGSSGSGAWGFAQRHTLTRSRSAPTLEVVRTAVPVTIVISKQVAFGDRLAVVGATEALGCWSAAEAIPLQWSPGHVWSADVELAPGLHHFKCVSIKADGSIDWEHGDNRVIKVPDEPGTSLTACCMWCDTSSTIVRAAQLQLPNSSIAADDWWLSTLPGPASAASGSTSELTAAVERYPTPISTGSSSVRSSITSQLQQDSGSATELCTPMDTPRKAAHATTATLAGLEGTAAEDHLVFSPGAWQYEDGEEEEQQMFTPTSGLGSPTDQQQQQQAIVSAPATPDGSSEYPDVLPSRDQKGAAQALEGAKGPAAGVPREQAAVSALDATLVDSQLAPGLPRAGPAASTRSSNASSTSGAEGEVLSMATLPLNLLGFAGAGSHGSSGSRSAAGAASELEGATSRRLSDLDELLDSEGEVLLSGELSLEVQEEVLVEGALQQDGSEVMHTWDMLRSDSAGDEQQGPGQFLLTRELLLVPEEEEGEGSLLPEGLEAEGQEQSPAAAAAALAAAALDLLDSQEEDDLQQQQPQAASMEWSRLQLLSGRGLAPVLEPEGAEEELSTPRQPSATDAAAATAAEELGGAVDAASLAQEIQAIEARVAEAAAKLQQQQQQLWSVADQEADAFPPQLHVRVPRAQPLLPQMAPPATEVQSQGSVSGSTAGGPTEVGSLAATSGLVLVARAHSIPHVAKVQTGGEDAFFISGAGHGAIGVADGVSAWAEDGIDPGEYSRTLAAHAAEAWELRVSAQARRNGAASGNSITSNRSGSSASMGSQGSYSSSAVPGSMRGASRALDPRGLLRHAQMNTYKPGSATMVLAALEPGGLLHIANLGDCGVKVVRRGVVVLSTEPQQHEFNLPYQMSHPRLFPETDIADTADRYTLAVQPGDVIVAASDGLFDNLWDAELLELLQEAATGQPARPAGPDASHKLTRSSSFSKLAALSKGGWKAALRRVGSGGSMAEVVDHPVTAPARSCSSEVYGPDEFAQRAARLLAQRAAQHAADKDFKSPWSVAAGQVYGLMAKLFAKGGKMDDITVVVAQVQEATGLADFVERSSSGSTNGGPISSR